MTSVRSVFVKCPQCSGEDTFEIISVGDKLKVLPSPADFSNLYAAIRQAVYAECSVCGKEMEGHDLIDFLEQSLMEEGE